MKIQEVTIEGYQSHTNSTFRLSPGLTVITGPSDAGKTAIIRALRWFAFNEPTGEAFLHTIRNPDGSVKERPQGLPEIEVIGMLESSGHDHSRRVHDPDGISPTATAVAGGTHHIKIFDHTKYRVRKLTPTEYGRLQAFPMDNWKQVVSNSQAYKQFGNAVTVTLAEGIGKSIIGYLDSVLGGAAV